MQEINAKITKARLGFEGHGLLSSSIVWDGQSGCGGFGHLHLGGPCMAIWVDSILRLFEYDDWSQLEGTFIRVRCEGFGGRTLAIGHILEDRWVTLEGILAEMEKAIGRCEAAA
jgi:hypothetical protein